MLKFCILLSARLSLPVITIPLLAVQSGLPGCLAFEPLCLNMCVGVYWGVCTHTYMHVRSYVLERALSLSPEGAGANETSTFSTPPLSRLGCFFDSVTYPAGGLASGFLGGGESCKA